MSSATFLIPARFLTIVAHYTICIILIWNPNESVKSCLSETVSEEVFNTQHTQLMAGIGISLTMMIFEFLSFLYGITMFNSTSALISISGHAAACSLLCCFILDHWQCGWFWWIFAFGSCVPITYDTILITDIIINKKY